MDNIWIQQQHLDFPQAVTLAVIQVQVSSDLDHPMISPGAARRNRMTRMPVPRCGDFSENNM
jgi:hypothetical protein